MDVGILTKGGYNIDGMVNSASDFNENSFEKTKEEGFGKLLNLSCEKN